MRKELGKWLMDISKYIITAVLLTTVFSDLENKDNIYILGIITVVLTLGAGLILVKEPSVKKNNSRNNKKRK